LHETRVKKCREDTWQALCRMKRARKVNVDKAEVEKELCSMFPEIQQSIAFYVSKECETVRDYLSFHATSQFLWAEYSARSETYLLQLCLDKVSRNRVSLSNTLLVEYKNNAVAWIHFSCVVKNIPTIIERIKKVDFERLGVKANYVTTETGLSIPDWHLLNGVELRKSSSGDGGGHRERYLCPSGVIVLNALADRVFSRYQWRFYFEKKGLAVPKRLATKIFFPLPADTINVDLSFTKLYIY
jgi:hypothetical protein